MELERPDLDGSTAFITGTTRGIGKEIALALADCGCNVVSTGKTVDDSDSDLEGTIHKTADACRERGVESLAIQLDVRDPDAVEAAAQEAIDEFGEVDIVINNASAIHIADVEDVSPKRFDLMTDVNVRGTFLTSRAFIPHLKQLDGSWILTNAPPIEVDRSPGKAPYAWSKMGMSFVTLSLASELDDHDVGCNTFWPVTAIKTRATEYFGLGTERDWREPRILSDTVLEILKNDPSEYTGNALLDEDVLSEAGVEDLSEYNCVEDANPPPMSVRMFEMEF
ncbi:MAG: SDR family oxidoreductase [Halobacteriales archaeon]